MRLRRLAFFLPVAVFLGVAAYLMVGLRGDPRWLPSALLDKPAPEFALPALEGRGAQAANAGFSSADLGKGEPSLVNRSEEHTSELQSLMRISYAVFCLKNKKKTNIINNK